MFAVTCLLPCVLFSCCISRKSGKYSTLGQIQHAAAFQVYNIEIKVHFPLISPTQSTIMICSDEIYIQQY